MTDLQASLIGIGAFIVAGVVSYNKWQEHKAKRSVERAFSSTPHDTLMAGEDADLVPERSEPFFDAPQDDAMSAQPQVAEAAAQDWVQAEPEWSAPQSMSQQDADLADFPEDRPVQASPLDDLIDCAIPFNLESPVRGEKVLPALQSLRHVGNKPIHVLGQQGDGSWELVAVGSVYFALGAGVQLANRSGALNELEYSELVMRLRQAADEIGAEPHVPDMLQVINAARSLQHFIAEYDAQLSVNVQANGAPWAVSTLLGALGRQGFDLRPDGRLVMPDGDGGILFSLSTNVALAEETTARLTLLLDVPRVAAERNGFAAMISCGKSLAARLDGCMVDDGNQPLSDAAIAEISNQVQSFYSDMQGAGIPAGSTRALRLFS